jgi:predicted PurR-regulated permease PerM
MYRPPPQESPWRGIASILVIVTVGVALANLALVVPFVAPLTWALTLAVATFPLHQRIARRIDGPSIAAGCSTLIVSVVICVPFVYAGTTMVEEALDAAQRIQEAVNEGAIRAAVPPDSSLRPAADWLSRQLERGGYQKQAAGLLVSGAQMAASRSLYVVTEALITLLVLFYFFRDGRAFLCRAPRVLPLSVRETFLVRSRIATMIRAMVYGTLAVALLQGALGAVAFWWLDLPAPFLWGGVMALLSILPVFGAALVWVPVALYLAVQGDLASAITLAAWGAIVIGLVDNLLKPKLVNQQVRLHTLVIFIAVLGGLVTYGPTGVMLGPIVVATGIALWDVWRRRLATEGKPKQVGEAGFG